MSGSLHMSRGRLWRAHVIDTKYQFVRMMRNPIVYLPLLATPVAMYGFLAFVVGPTLALPIPLKTAQTNTFINWMVFGLMGPAMLSFGVGVAAERDAGVMTLKRALPMPPFAYLLSKLLAAVMFAGVVIASMTLVNVLFSQVDLTVGQYLQLFVAGSCMVVPFCALGLAVGASLPVAAALALTNVGWIGLTMLGGLLFPVPRWLAVWVPTYYAAQLNRGIAGLPTDAPIWISVAVLGALTLLFGSLALNRLNAANAR